MKLWYCRTKICQLADKENNRFFFFALSDIVHQFKDGAYKYRSIFAQFMTMREKQFLARPIEIQKENWG